MLIGHLQKATGAVESLLHAIPMDMRTGMRSRGTITASQFDTTARAVDTAQQAIGEAQAVLKPLTGFTGGGTAVLNKHLGTLEYGSAALDDIGRRVANRLAENPINEQPVLVHRQPLADLLKGIDQLMFDLL